jgi:hypothetical protein
MKLLVAIEITDPTDSDDGRSYRKKQFHCNAVSAALRLIADSVMNGGAGDREVAFERDGLSATYRFETSSADAVPTAA